MAATATERRLLLDGEWVETGEWIEVRSPYSGDVVGRVAKAGAEEARRAVDAAERAMAEPLPAHERAAILDRVAALLRERHDEVARTISVEATTVAEVVRAMEALAPGFAFYVCDEAGRVRQHVVIFVGEERIKDRGTLSDPVGRDSRVMIVQALSGG